MKPALAAINSSASPSVRLSSAAKKLSPSCAGRERNEETERPKLAAGSRNKKGVARFRFQSDFRLLAPDCFKKSNASSIHAPGNSRGAARLAGGARGMPFK